MPEAQTPFRLVQVALRVLDLERAIAFYRDVLGLPFLFRAEPGMAFFDLDGVRLLLGTVEASGPLERSTPLYLGATDIEATARRMRAAGVTFHKEPALIARMPEREVWLAEFVDSEGNVMALMEER
ncbi:MAG: VOC family protein [Gemmatimonadales bacterium]